MNKHEMYEQKTEELVTPIVNRENYELVDIEYVKEGENWYLRVYLDKEGGITIDDLVVVNHELSDLLDEKDFIDESYILEVSSPGLTRPFKKKKDYIRNLGKDVEVKTYSPLTWEEKGKKLSAKEFVGVLKEFKEDQITLQIDEDASFEIMIKDIALIRGAIDF